MKYLKHYIFLLSTVLMYSCAEEKHNSVTGEGRLSINASIEQALTESRADASNEALLSSLHIVVSDNNGIPYKYWQSADEMGMNEASGKAEFTLNQGEYIIEGWAGDSVPASFTKKFYKGIVPATILAGETSNIDLICKIANVAFKVNYDEVLAPLFKEKLLEVGHRYCEALVFDDTKLEEDSTAYFMMPKGDKNLTWSFSGVLFSDQRFERSGVIENALPGMLYTLNFKYEAPEFSDMGAVYLEGITCDVVVTPNYEEKLNLRVSPKIEFYRSVGASRTLLEKNSVTSVKGEAGEINFVMRSSGKITDVVLRGDELIAVIGTNAISVISRESDSMLDYWREELRNSEKFAWEDVVLNGSTESSYFMLTLNADYLNQLENGKYQWEISVTDEDYRYASNNQIAQDIRTSTATFELQISDLGAVLVEVPSNSNEQLQLWDNQKLLKAQIVKPGSSVTFRYREGSSGDWIELASSDSYTDRAGRSIKDSSGDFRYAIVPDLKEGVTYEYQIEISTVDKEETDIQSGEFTVPAFAQLPNGDFEQWSTKGRGFLIPGENSTTNFWESGNEGASTAQITNVTQYNAEFNTTPGGQYCAHLKSQIAGLSILGSTIGKMAAGNIFVGKYLKTDGTDGVLGWGKPFTAMPKKLRFNVRYRGVTVNEGNNTPRINKGDMDQGIVYIALLDDDINVQGTTYEGVKYPVEVRTKDAHLFDSEASNVIAYGEWTSGGVDTAGDGMVTVEINFDYHRLDTRPTYIMLTASASIGGDYFTGGDGSQMWLDDLVLIY